MRAQAAKPVGVKPLEVTEVAAAHALVAGASEGDLVASGSSGELRVTGDGAREVGRGNLGSKFENLLARFEAQALTLETQSGELLELRGQVKAQDLKLEELSAALGVLSPDADLARAGVRELMELRESVRVDSAELQSARAEVCALHHEVLESCDVVVAQRIRLVNVEDFQLAILEVFYSVSVGWETLVEESRLLRLCVARVENRVDQAFALAASSRLWIKNEAVKVLREAGFKVRHPNEWTTGSPAENKKRRREAAALGVKPTTLVHSNQRVMMPKILAADESIQLSVVELPLPQLDSVDGVSPDELRARENIALRHLRLAHLGSVVMTYAEEKFSKSELARAVELQLEVAKRVVSERALYLTSGGVTGTELGWALDGQALVAEGVMPPSETVEFRLKKQLEFEKLRAILLKPGPLLPGADPGVPSAGVHLDPVWVAELLASPDAVDARLEGGGDAVFGSGDAVVTQVHGEVTLEGGAVTGGAVQRTVGTAVLEGDAGSPDLVTEPLEAWVVEAESLEAEPLETEPLETEPLEAEDLDDENMEVEDSEVEDSEIELPRVAVLEGDQLEGDQLEDNVEFPPVEMFDEDIDAGRQVLNESRVDSGRGDSGRGHAGRVISSEDDEINPW